MSTNHHTPIVPGAPAVGLTLNSPLGELDSALSALISGTSGLDVLRLVEKEVEINAGAITRDASVLIVKAPNPLTQGNLSTLSGGNDGDIVALRAYTGHKILVAQGASTNQFALNINTAGWLVLNENRYTIFVRSGGLWREIASTPDWNAPGTITNGTRPQRIIAPRSSLSRDGIREHLYLHYMPSVRNWAMIRAAGAGFQPIGLAAPTVTGTGSNANDDDGNWTRTTSGATSGNAAGIVTTFDVTRFPHQPRFEINLKTDANVGNMRLWAGLFHTTPPNGDTLAGAGIAFRWSTAVPDANWIAVLHDGSSQVEVDTGVAVNTDSVYNLAVRDFEDGAYFVINGVKIGSTPISWPSVSTDLGLSVRVITQTAAARSVRIARHYVEHN